MHVERQLQLKTISLVNKVNSSPINSINAQFTYTYMTGMSSISLHMLGMKPCT